jgi:hypothetical protein
VQKVWRRSCKAITPYSLVVVLYVVVAVEMTLRCSLSARSAIADRARCVPTPVDKERLLFSLFIHKTPKE